MADDGAQRSGAAAGDAADDAGAFAVTLGGWDTANALSFDRLNEAIAAEGTSPPDFLAEDDWGGGKVEGKWGDWRLVADPAYNGATLKMACPIASGTWTASPTKSADLAGTVVYMTIDLAALNDPEADVSDPTATGGTPQSLKVRTDGAAENPPVSIVAIVPGPSAGPAGPHFEDMDAIFKSWFIANVHDFDQVFHTAVINAEAAKGDFQWLKPTTLSYASVVTTGGTGHFAALCQTDNDPARDNAQQVDATIGRDIPKGADAVFAISGEKFAQHILRLGASQVLEGSKVEDFDVVGDQLIVTNNKPLVWRKCTMEDGTVIEPTVPEGGLRMRVVEDQIELDFTGVHYSHPLLKGNSLISISFKQYVYVVMGRREDGTPVLKTTNRDPKLPKPDWAAIAHDPAKLNVEIARQAPVIYEPKITVTPDAEARNFERVMMYVSIGLAVFAVVTLGASFAAGKVASGAAEATEAAIEAGDAAIEVAIDAAELAPEAGEVASSTSEAATAASNTASAMPGAKLLTYITRFAMLAPIATGAVGIAERWEVADDMELEDESVPSMTEFLNNVLGAARWPQMDDWELVDVRLAESLLLYGNLKTKA